MVDFFFSMQALDVRLQLATHECLSVHNYHNSYINGIPDCCGVIAGIDIAQRKVRVGMPCHY